MKEDNCLLPEGQKLSIDLRCTDVCVALHRPLSGGKKIWPDEVVPFGSHGLVLRSPGRHLLGSHSLKSSRKKNRARRRVGSQRFATRAGRFIRVDARKRARNDCPSWGASPPGFEVMKETQPGARKLPDSPLFSVTD